MQPLTGTGLTRTGIVEVEDSEPEREAARIYAQEERRKRRTISQSSSQHILSSSPRSHPRTPTHDTQVVAPNRADVETLSDISNGKKRNPHMKIPSSSMVSREPAAAQIAPEHDSYEEIIEVSSDAPPTPPRPAGAASKPNPIGEVGSSNEIIVLSDSEESEVNMRHQLMQFRYGPSAISCSGSSSSEASGLSALAVDTTSTSIVPLGLSEVADPESGSTVAERPHPPPVPASKPKARAALNNALSATFHDARLAKLSRCVACELQWTVRKTIVEKVKHISACARKRGLNEETLITLVEQELGRALADEDAPSRKAKKGKGKEAGDNVAAVPRTFLAEVTKDVDGRKRGKRLAVSSTVINPAESRTTILGRARALLGSEPPPDDVEPLPIRRALTSSGARIAEEMAKADQAKVDQLRAMTVVAEGPPLTQAFGRSTLAKPSRLASVMGPPRSLFLDESPPAVEQPAVTPRPVRTLLLDDSNSPSIQPTSVLQTIAVRSTSHGEDTNLAKHKRLQAIASALAEQPGKVASSSIPPTVSPYGGDFRSYSSKELHLDSGPTSPSIRGQYHPPSPHHDGLRLTACSGSSRSADHPPITNTSAWTPDVSWSHDDAHLHWSPPSPQHLRSPLPVSTSSTSSSKRRRITHSRSRSRSRSTSPLDPASPAKGPSNNNLNLPDEPPPKKPKSKRKPAKAKDGDEFAASLEDLETKMLDLILANEAMHLRILRYEPIDFAVFMQMAKDAGFPERGLKLVLKPFLDKQAIQFYAAEGTVGRARTKRE